MGTSDAEPYLRLVEHDLEALDLITAAARGRTPTVDVSDWQCTLVYYMACIYVKAVGRARGKDLQDHYQLKQWINTTTDLVPITRPYRKLEERSRDARYEGRRFTRPELIETIGWFAQVRDHLVGVLKEEGVEGIPVVDPTRFV
ncbi:MAG: hypothetical protein HUU06_06650 [Planctomycetaceae bacterium]|nr:hypothetical protein [Planctomycetota bacterium]NUN52450.1 hypothetical protein [Planctomycetaceae bacterium]